MNVFVLTPRIYTHWVNLGYPNACVVCGKPFRVGMTVYSRIVRGSLLKTKSRHYHKDCFERLLN